MRPCVSVAGHALHAMHAGFELQPREDAAPVDRGDDFLVAAGGAFAGRHELDLPAVQFGVALVHAEQVAGEQRRLVAARAGADFEDDAVLVGGVLGQQREADRAVRVASMRLCGVCRVPPRASARISASVAGSASMASTPASSAVAAAPGADGLHDGLEFRQFARQRDEFRAGRAACQSRGDFVVAAQDEIELVGREHGRIRCNPAMASGRRRDVRRCVARAARPCASA